MSHTQAAAVTEPSTEQRRHAPVYDAVYDEAPAPARRGPSATASSWLGVIGLVVTLFAPWGAVASIAALVFGIAARPVDASAHANRVVGVVTSLIGLLFATLWIVASVQHGASTAG